MKDFIIACLAFSAMIVLSNAEYSEEYKAAIDTCLKGMKVSSEDFIKMIENDDGNVACIFACVNKEIKMFDGEKFDGKLIHDEVRKEMSKNNKEYTDELKTSMDKCIVAGNNAKGDECKKTEVFMTCVFTDPELAKLGKY